MACGDDDNNDNGDNNNINDTVDMETIMLVDDGAENSLSDAQDKNYQYRQRGKGMSVIVFTQLAINRFYLKVVKVVAGKLSF